MLFAILQVGFSKKKSRMVLTSLAVLLVMVASYVLVDSASQPNSDDKNFLENTKNVLDDYLGDIPKRKDNQIFEQNIQTLHAEIDDKVRQSDIANNTQIRQMVKKSNDMFSELDSPKEFIQSIEEQWESSDPESPGSISYNLTNNRIAEILRDVVNSDQKSESKFKYAEIFVTNSYGVNVAQTGKTSDYLQADEIWWKEARQNGLFVADGYFDDSAGVYATEIAMAITDDGGNFIGVVKIVLNIDSIDHNKMLINYWTDTIFR